MKPARTARSMHGTSRTRWAGVALTAVALSTCLVLGSATTQAETGMKALVLDPYTYGGGGAASTEAIEATANGFTVDAVDLATWASMTTAQFADYQLIVAGDSRCGGLPTAVTQNGTALADAVMARAGGNTKVGRRVVIGTDPRAHLTEGGAKLIKTAIAFAGAQDGATNLYLPFGCGGHPQGPNLLDKLTDDPTPVWSLNTTPQCNGSVSLISQAAEFAAMTTADLLSWTCSVHETFPTYPTDWAPLSLANDRANKATCGTDVDTGATRCGEAYILIAGPGIVATAPGLDLTPATATSVIGGSHAVTATIVDSNGAPRSGVVVSFVLTGANASAVGTCAPATCTTGAAGKVTFTYTGAVAGVDSISAAATISGSRQTTTATKTWTSPVAPPAVVAPPPAPVVTPPVVKQPVNPLLACTKRKLVLIDVLQRGARVVLRGATDPALAGKRVSFVFAATHKQVATATVAPDGGFSATAPLPPRLLRSTNRARYTAVIGTDASAALKLVRRVIVTSMTSANRKVTISGRVVAPLGRPIAPITVNQRVGCLKTKVVKTFKPTRDGRFVVTVPAPAGATTAVYVLRTNVRRSTRSRTAFLTKSLPREVTIR